MPRGVDIPIVGVEHHDGTGARLAKEAAAGGGCAETLILFLSNMALLCPGATEADADLHTEVFAAAAAKARHSPRLPIIATK